MQLDKRSVVVDHIKELGEHEVSVKLTPTKAVVKLSSSFPRKLPKSPPDPGRPERTLITENTKNTEVAQRIHFSL